MIKIGDRVKYNNQPCQVVLIRYPDALEWRYQIKYLHWRNSFGSDVICWVGESDITLDIEYYRDKKLNDILNQN